MQKSLPPIAIALLTLSACGGDSHGGACSSEIISDYNATVATDCAVRSQKTDCIAAINSFLSHYPKANCTARKLNSGPSWEDNSSSISASELKDRRDSMSASLAY